MCFFPFARTHSSDSTFKYSIPFSFGVFPLQIKVSGGCAGPQLRRKKPTSQTACVQAKQAVDPGGE
jgi:hypothetical protein